MGDGFRSDALAVGIYGGLRAVTAATSGSDDDCFSIFHGLSAVLGMSGPVPDSGLWGMNDAAGPLGPDGPATALRGWFQVTPIGDTSVSMPVESLASVGAAVLGRFGELTLSGFEFHLPLHTLTTADTGSLLDAGAWFRTAPADAHRSARLTVEFAGDDPRPSLEDLTRTLSGGGGAIAGFAVDERPDASAVEFTGEVPWRWWLGEPGSTRTTTVGIRLPEWSPVAAGRAVRYAGTACRASGTGPVGVRIEVD